MKKNSFIIIGDTHGNHKLIIHRIKSLKITDQTLFHVGDFGVGFVDMNLDIERMEELNDVLNKHNCHLYVTRGNHDNPIFFEGKHNYSNLHLVKDYSVIEFNGENVLMCGGAVSVDRLQRKEYMFEAKKNGRNIETYWIDENFNLDEKKLIQLTDIDYVITHSSPSFVYPYNDTSNIVDSHGPFVQNFAWNDYGLKNDLNKERADLTKMYEILIEKNDIRKWFYGHFHTSKTENVSGTEFILLNCNEFLNVYQDIEDEL